MRWTTPVIQFARTATEDYELRGTKIRAGESRVSLLSLGESRRRRLRRADPLPHRPRSRTSTSASAAASTSASARTSRASSCAAPSRSCASAWSTWSSPARRARALELRRRHQARADPVAPRKGVSFRRAIVGSIVVWALIVPPRWLAGEQTEVVVLRTRDDAGKELATKMWVVDVDGVTWVRVANPAPRLVPAAGRESARRARARRPRRAAARASGCVAGGAHHRRRRLRREVRPGRSLVRTARAPDPVPVRLVPETPEA